MKPSTPRSTLTDTLFPATTLFRSRLHRDVERTRRLVGDEQLGAERERPRETRALPLPAAELVREPVAEGSRQLDGFEQLVHPGAHGVGVRSEEHTSELQSLMRISYAVFCLKKKKPMTNKKKT